MNPADLRREYVTRGLSESDVDKNPFEQFARWFSEAVAGGVLEPNAMVLGTASKSGRVSTRVVLMKGFDLSGFVFFTNYGSKKSQQIDANPNVSLSFPWLLLERQVNITGAAEKVPRVETEAYFKTRPRGSQLGAWASAQSEVVTSRESLERRLESTAAAFEGKDIPPPPNWGGFRVKPRTIEFWQGRPNRMHDRIQYRLERKIWVIERLSP